MMSFNIAVGRESPRTLFVLFYLSVTAIPAPQRYMLNRWITFTFLTFVTSVSYGQVAIQVPDGYVLQRLDVTGGFIARPKEWYVEDGRTGSGWAWSMTAEDTRKSKGKYETGLQLHALVGVELYSKKSRALFAKDFLSDKKLEAKVVRECPVTSEGKLKRQCLEVIERRERENGVRSYHMLYWVFWSDEIDIVGMFMFGGPEGDWESIKHIGDVLSQVQLIGPGFDPK